jgi:hypothetical protein
LTLPQAFSPHPVPVFKYPGKLIQLVYAAVHVEPFTTLRFVLVPAKALTEGKKASNAGFWKKT